MHAVLVPAGAVNQSWLQYACQAIRLAQPPAACPTERSGWFAMENLMTESLETEYDALLFAARRSVRYHRHRERFLHRVDHLGLLLSMFGGLVTAIAFVAPLPVDCAWLPLSAIGVTALGGVLGLNLGYRARRHDSLARDFVFLEQELLAVRSDLTSKTLLALQMRRLAIEAAEPPVYRVLDAMCHDELITALGHDPRQRTNVTWWQRLCRHFFDLAPERIEKRVR